MLGCGLVEEAQRVADHATQHFPTSSTVWVCRLQCEATVAGREEKTAEEEEEDEEEEDRLSKLCREAIDKVPFHVHK